MNASEEKDTPLWKDVAEGIFSSRSLLDKSEDHKKDPRKKPSYWNLRPYPEGHMPPELIEKTGQLVWNMMARRYLSMQIQVAGVPKGGDPFAKAVSKISGLPLLQISRDLRYFSVDVPRTNHHKNGRVVLIENAVTSGGSVIKAVEAVRRAGLAVSDAIVVVECEEIARYRLEDLRVQLHTCFTARDLFNFGCKHGYITQTFRDLCLAFQSFR